MASDIKAWILHSRGPDRSEEVGRREQYFAVLRMVDDKYDTGLDYVGASKLLKLQRDYEEKC
ncbi:hypothetical protein DOTSEDRAFT_73774 [Dothistroma septosporum NZE10]|uniref:Uncharacterized protein n=1 Tax=Dothistroma septosporum (strain NZE10 / CBS 128990) TaxID=675120 RepID=N1PIU1_DOTSN|nr:hypothetical protein DOTSEDRAFT_73774 [Dothistroma septosporum NZE10]